MNKDSLFIGVNARSDPNNLTDLERKHIPVIGVAPAVRIGESFDVTIEVGQAPAHAGERGHFVEFIDLYADETYLARASLSAVAVCPKVTFTVVPTFPFKELRACARCNLHGLWVGTAPIAVQ